MELRKVQGIDSEALMLALRDEIAFSNGAACSTTGRSSNYVLQAMGLPGNLIDSAIRLSWGPGIEAIPVGVLIEAIIKLRC